MKINYGEQTKRDLQYIFAFDANFIFEKIILLLIGYYKNIQSFLLFHWQMSRLTLGAIAARVRRDRMKYQKSVKNNIAKFSSSVAELFVVYFRTN